MGKTKELTPSIDGDFIKKRSQVKEVWRRFCRNKQAMVGMCMLLLLVFAAIFANIIAPYDPIEQDIVNRLARTNSDVIFLAEFFMGVVFLLRLV